jgi:C4-dicarboxylate transporter/malic acid transport protein
MNRFRLDAVTPNWFASVMGTGIVANAAAGFPLQLPGVRAAALAVWVLAAGMLVFLLVATAIHWLRHPQIARSHHRHPVMAHFYGAPPMAMLTVGAGALLVGRDLIGEQAALTVDELLWVVGTALGLLTAVAIPVLAFTIHEAADDSAFGGWLMPVVPPMVSAATGALLLPHLNGTARQTMVLACLAMFGLSLLASLFVIAQLWGRLTRHKVGPAAMVPTLWIVLGPLGQSITALTLLARNDGSSALRTASVLIGVPILGFALLWLAIATVITLRTARHGMPFALTWWSFTFPVGTCATGATGLAIVTGAPALLWPAAAFLLLLVGAWLLVAARTVAAQFPAGRRTVARRSPGGAPSALGLRR